MTDYGTLGLDPYLNSSDSLGNTKDLKSYIDSQIGNIYRPGGLNYTQTGIGRGYQAVVGMNPTQGAFTDIQNAINYTSSLGGGQILIEPGTYRIDKTISITSSGIGIVGKDRNTTSILVQGSTNIGTLLWLNGADNVSISNITFDGNKTNQTNGHLLLKVGTCNNVLIENCNYQNQFGSSASGTGGTFGAIYDMRVNRMKIENCNFTNCDGWAVNSTNNYVSVLNCFVGTCGGGFNLGFAASIEGCYIDFTNDPTKDGFVLGGGQNRAINCVAQGISGNSFVLDSGANSSVTNCQSILGSGVGFVVDIDGQSVTGCVSDRDVCGGSLTLNAQGCLFSNNIIMDPKQNGIISTSGKDNIISNNNISSPFNNGTVSGNTFSGILLSGTSIRNTVVGNRIWAQAGTVTYKYGVREDTSADNYNLIVGNIINSGSTAYLGTQGGSTIAANNILG